MCGNADSRCQKCTRTHPQLGIEPIESTDNGINFKTFKSVVSSLPCDALRVYLVRTIFIDYVSSIGIIFFFWLRHNDLSCCDARTALAFTGFSSTCFTFDVRHFMSVRHSAHLAPITSQRTSMESLETSDFHGVTRHLSNVGVALKFTAASTQCRMEF